MPQVMTLYDKLVKQKVDGVNIIVVDNGSTDGMRATNFHKESGIRYVKSDRRINENFLLTHALLKESTGEFVCLLPFTAHVNNNYLNNILNFLINDGKDINLGAVEATKSRRSTIGVPDRRELSKLDIPGSFFSQNIVMRRKMMFQAGLFDESLFNVPNATKMLCYNMIKLFKATYTIDKTFPIVVSKMPDVKLDITIRSFKEDYDKFSFVFKNYLDKNVYRIAKGTQDDDNVYHAPINLFIVLPTKNNDELERLIMEQKAKGDRVYKSNLPKYMAKRLGYIFQKHTDFDYTAVIHENAPFKYPYFIDDFKKHINRDESMIWASDGDFRTFELRPSTVTSNMSICVPKNFLWEPGLNETMNWDELIRKMAELQPDQRISDLFIKPKPKADITNTSGDGGPATVVAVPKPHKKSWYDWMED